MKSKIKYLYSLVFLFSLLIVFLWNACDESGFAREIPKEADDPNASLPEVIINEVSEEKIVDNSVDLDCFIKSDGGARVTKSGICWGGQSNPTIENANFTTNGPIIGQIPAFIGGLEYDSTYYARAYAINSKGIAYSETVSFTTGKKQEDKIFRDDFDRMMLGLNWKIHTGNFQIENNLLRAASSGHVLYEVEDAKTIVDDGHFFELETDFHIAVVSDFAFGGVVLNAQNGNEFYVLRISGTGVFQFLATNNGGQGWPGVFVNKNTDVIGNTTYHLKIFSDTPGEFDVVIKKGDQIMVDEKVVDPDARYKGGYVGYFSFAEFSLFDNFSLYIK